MNVSPKPLLLENAHHNNPESRGGSDHDDNISVVDRYRHDAFHREWANNFTPDEMLRHMTLHAIGYQGQSPHPATVDRLLNITKVSCAGLLYKPHTIAVDQYSPQAPRKIRRNATLHLEKEQGVVTKTADAIFKGEAIPQDFMDRCTAFFGVSQPQAAMQRLLTEEYDGLSWTKSLQDDVRTQCLNILVRAPVDFAMETKHDLMRILSHHARQLQHHIRHLADTAPTGATPRNARRLGLSPAVQA